MPANLGNLTVYNSTPMVGPYATLRLPASDTCIVTQVLTPNQNYTLDHFYELLLDVTAQNTTKSSYTIDRALVSSLSLVY